MSTVQPGKMDCHQPSLLDQPAPQQTTPTDEFRRRAYVRMSPEAIISLLRAKEVLVLDHDGRAYSLSSTLPADANAVRGWVKATIGDEGDVCIVVESESLEPVPWGDAIPEIRVLTTMVPAQPSPLGTEAAHAILSHVPDFPPTEFNKSPV